ncbi:MAG TPA: hypothetical protein VK327_09420, partial [Candidatus Paceibacterota bacterium]|nr:hypothetical protein [Candidatus Paceibacterota bacterium]
CGSVIYSRRNVLCGVCGKRLPDELLFSPEQRKSVEKDLTDLKKRRQARESQDNSTNSPSGIWGIDVGGM